jgi:hypothetical protein
MIPFLRSSLCLAFSAALLASANASADYTVTCKSHGYKYTSCPISQSGYVTLSRQLSSANCEKGRTWDYDRREIWVDDGCGAEFRVEAGSHHGKHDNAKIAGAVAGLAILGALAYNESHKDDHKYQDDNYYGSRHASYVPSWMVGRFRGYNPMYGAEVMLTIDADGRVRGNAGNETVSGYINDEQLHVGNVIFDIDQTREGFITAQKGDRHNEVRYRRID